MYGQFVRKRAEDDGAQSTNDWIRDWLARREQTDPFFLFVNYLEPHLEYKPPREHAVPLLPEDVSYNEAMAVNQDAWQYIAKKADMSERDFEILEALYQAEISYLDERIGELKELLQEEGEWKDTIFILTGDHGENIGEHRLMDHQYCLYETLLHVPLVIHGREFTGGGTVDELIQLTDLVPTLLDAVDIDAPGFREQLQARSFYPAADTASREYVVAEYMAPQPSMEALEGRVGEIPDPVYKYNRSLRAIRTDRWKLIRGSDGSVELYNIENDPGETTDCSGDKEEIRRELADDLDDWLDSFDRTEYSDGVRMKEGTKQRLEDLGYLQ
ncbi:sulfatase [Halovenus salina]|uniref:Sulfatase n=1 Tax=Halovenus salina TaxID=1510225 RepID=A0ABD5VYN4_9EURY